MWTLQYYVNIVFIVGTLKFLTLNLKTNGQRFNAVVSQHLRMGFQESLWMGFTETWRGICWGDIGDEMICGCNNYGLWEDVQHTSYSSRGFQADFFNGVEELRKPLNTWVWLESTWCLLVWWLRLHHASLTDSLSFMISIWSLWVHFTYTRICFSRIVHRLHSNYVQLLHLVTIGDLPLAQVGRTRQLGLCKKLSPFHFLWAFGFNMIEHTHGPLKETVASPGRISSTQPNRVIFQTFDTSVAVLPTVWHASIEWLGCKICRISVLLSIFLHLRC